MKPAFARSLLLLVVAFAVACWFHGATVPAWAQSPLEQQRPKQWAPATGTPALTGWVVSVQSGMIYTSMAADWRSTGISDGTVLRVRLAGRTFEARFLDPATYSRVVTDPAARRGLDMDIICTLDQSGALVVVGLGGGLPEAFGVRAGAPVAIEKP
jgi:hypothetical protein